MAEDSHHLIIDIDPEIKVEEKTKNGPKKRLQLNPAKAVIGGISQSTNVVKGGISHSTKPYPAFFVVISKKNCCIDKIRN